MSSRIQSSCFSRNPGSSPRTLKTILRHSQSVHDLSTKAPFRPADSARTAILYRSFIKFHGNKSIQQLDKPPTYQREKERQRERERGGGLEGERSLLAIALLRIYFTWMHYFLIKAYTRSTQTYYTISVFLFRKMKDQF